MRVTPTPLSLPHPTPLHKQHANNKHPCKHPYKHTKTVKKVLGQGQFGTTRLVVDKKTGERLAMKSIGKRKLVTPEDVEDVRREVQIMHHLEGHPNVVALRGAYEDKHHVHLLMELCS